MTERAQSNILPPSAVKAVATQGQKPHLAPKHRAQDVRKLPKLAQGRLCKGPRPLTDFSF